MIGSTGLGLQLIAEGKSHPWGSPWLIFLDTTRLVIILGFGSAVALLFIAVVQRHISAVRALAVFSFALYVCETEFEHIGTGVGFGGRLWFGLIATIAVVRIVWTIIFPVKDPHATVQHQPPQP